MFSSFLMVSKNLLVERCEANGIPVNKSMKKEDMVSLIAKSIDTVTQKFFEGNTFDVIYHCADIHIRYFERHEEYRQVFERLYTDLEKAPENALLVLAGDIFHNRDKFVSETIIIFDEFITRLTSILPVVAILGNHDCFSNADRLDSLSGFTGVKDYSNFFLLKESGYYTFGNVLFGVSSIVDSVLLGAPRFETDKVKVGLYHGIVTGASVNATVLNGVSREIFKDYDITLLGDVHKRQFITDTMAYPGSLIQQNFKEERLHGILKWELAGKTAKFIVVQNDYCYVDVPVKGPLPEFSKSSRIRLLVEPETTETEIKDRTAEIKQHTKVLSIKNFMTENRLTRNDTEDYEHVDINVKEEQIISEYVESAWMSEILDIHRDLQSKIESEDLNFKESIPWKIKKVSFMNIFSYGNDKMNVIDLSEGVIGILAGNASGKTNILNIIMYGMFGNIYARNQNQNNRNVISRYAIKEGLFVKLEVVTDDGTVYFIERTAKKRVKTSKTALNETLEFYTEDKRLNLGTKPETEKLVREQLSFLGKEEFILTNMMSNITYGSGMSIVGMCGSQLDEVFNGMFNLNKYKLLHAEAKKKEKILSETKMKLNAKISLIEKYLAETDPQKLQVKIKENETSITVYKQNIDKLKNKLADIDNSLLSLKQVLIEEDEQTLVKKIKENEAFLAEHYVDPSKETEIDRELHRLKEVYLTKKYSDLIGKPFKKTSLSPEGIAEKIKDLESQKVPIPYDLDITADYIAAKKALRNLGKEETLDLEKVKKVIKSLKKQESHYILPQEIYSDILSDLSKQYIDPILVQKYKKVISDKEERDAQIENNIKIDSEINTLKIALATKEIEIAHSMRDKLNQLSEQLEVIDTFHELQAFKELLKKIRDNSEVSELLTKKKNVTYSIEENTKELTKNSAEKSVLTSKLNDYTKYTEDKQQITPELKRIEREIMLYKKYIEVTHSKNLPKALISNAVKSITENANELIYNLTGLKCEIEENEKWEMNMTRNNNFIGPDHLSGYERFIVNVALKMAFDKFKVLSSIKLFIIDEVIDCVSEDNFENIDTLFEKLKEHYNTVILISHNEDLKKKVDSRIEIELEGRCSIVSV